MKRYAFSLIELIFVIIILGILASVVAVKMSGMSETAKEVQLKAMTGTLNRSVVGMLWYQSITENHRGSVRFASYDKIFKNSMTLVEGYESEPTLLSCNSDGNGTYLTYIYIKTYEIHCKDGSTTTSPEFRLYNLSDSEYLD